MKKSKRSCETCEWWDYQEKPGRKKKSGMCRTRPPLLDGDFCNDDFGIWPITHDVDWCAEWVGREP